MEIPEIGLGTFRLKDETAYNMTLIALKNGYRQIDTAKLYGNERHVGRAIRDSGVMRKEIFVTTKVWIDDIEKGKNSIVRSITNSLRKLGLEYIDLVLLHSPPSDDKIVETWKVLEDIKNGIVVELEGKIKNIGVSNYDVYHLEILLAGCETKPYVNQIELSPFLTRKVLVDYCKKNGVKIVAHTSLTKGKKFNDIRLAGLARQYECSVPGLLLAWGLSKGFIVLPRTSKAEHVIENIKSLEVKLPENVIEIMDTYNINYATHRKYMGLKMEKDKLLNLFHDFFDSYKHYCNDYIRQSFPREGKLEFDINQLTITNPIERMKGLYKEFGVLVFRDYAGEKELVIGCGNYPLANCGGYPLCEGVEEDNYHANHHHTGCYTINPAPSYNPSVMGAFSIHTFKNIPDNSFKHIDIEGIWLVATDTFYSEMTRLLKEGGSISCNTEIFMNKVNGKLEPLDGINLSEFVRLKE